jgi:hypothetical protein
MVLLGMDVNIRGSRQRKSLCKDPVVRVGVGQGQER